jgi:hypothetical protein
MQDEIPVKTNDQMTSNDQNPLTKCEVLLHRDGQSALREGVRLDAMLIGELITPGTDTRYGVNMICRPSQLVTDYILTLEEYLRKAEPDQYYYPQSDLHLTLLEICHSRTAEEAQRVARAVRANANKLFADLPAIKMGLPMLAFDQSGCALSFAAPGPELSLFRRSMFERLTDCAVPIAPRYMPQSAHITFLRYLRTPRIEPQEWARYILNAPRMARPDWVSSEVWITWGATWYGMRSRIAESGPSRLELINTAAVS